MRLELEKRIAVNFKIDFEKGQNKLGFLEKVMVMKGFPIKFGKWVMTYEYC